MNMPSMSQFKRFDVGPLLKRGEEPLPAVLQHIRSLAEGEGLIVVAPFLPAPLIELLGSQGFRSKVERGEAGSWIVYLWQHAN